MSVYSNTWGFVFSMFRDRKSCPFKILGETPCRYKSISLFSVKVTV